MDYTKEAKSRIKLIIHDAFGDYVKNIQLSTEDYREELDRIANRILAGTAAPAMYEALKSARNILNAWTSPKTCNEIDKALALADREVEK